jgi:hypothetical protein
MDAKKKSRAAGWSAFLGEKQYRHLYNTQTMRKWASRFSRQ